MPGICWFILYYIIGEVVIISCNLMYKSSTYGDLIMECICIVSFWPLILLGTIADKLKDKKLR